MKWERVRAGSNNINQRNSDLVVYAYGNVRYVTSMLNDNPPRIPNDGVFVFLRWIVCFSWMLYCAQRKSIIDLIGYEKSTLGD